MDVGGDLLTRHFVAQRHRPPDLADVAPDRIGDFARCLLVTDGTVSTLVEAHELEPVAVERAGAAPPVDGALTPWLDVGAGEAVLSRRIVMRGTCSGRVHVTAESHLVPARLPAEFVDVLGLSAKGLGEALRALRVDHHRELLWFGARGPVLSRTYRLLVAGRPAVLITESFPA